MTTAGVAALSPVTEVRVSLAWRRVGGHGGGRRSSVRQMRLTGPEAQQLYACPKGPAGAREQQTFSPDTGHLPGLFIAFK